MQLFLPLASSPLQRATWQHLASPAAAAPSPSPNKHAPPPLPRDSPFHATATPLAAVTRRPLRACTAEGHGAQSSADHPIRQLYKGAPRKEGTQHLDKDGRRRHRKGAPSPGLCAACTSQKVRGIRQPRPPCRQQARWQRLHSPHAAAAVAGAGRCSTGSTCSSRPKASASSQTQIQKLKASSSRQQGLAQHGTVPWPTTTVHSAVIFRSHFAAVRTRHATPRHTHSAAPTSPPPRLYCIQLCNQSIFPPT